MLRRAIISDIHSNLPALEAVLDDIRSQHADEIVCLGDICGYGPQPLECIARVRESARWVLLGNHDEAVYKEPLDFSKNAYDAIVWQRTLLDPASAGSAQEQALALERWEWLRQCQPQRVEGSIRYVHASPRDPLHEYVLKEDFDPRSGGPTPTGKALFAASGWLCFCGHSHRPGVVAEDYRWWTPAELENGRSLLRLGFKTIVNVGSVGQPRDGHPEACYVLFDYDPDSPACRAAGIESAAAAPGGAVQGDEGLTQIFPRRSSVRGSEALAESSPERGTMPAPERVAAPTAAGAAASLADAGADECAPRTASGAVLTGEDSDDETRTEKDGELQRARTTLISKSPKVTFRRVPYDVAGAQRRFFAVPQLPQYNALRLARGI